jgi:hypothetical protein
MTISDDETADIMKKYKALVQQVFNLLNVDLFKFGAHVKNLTLFLLSNQYAFKA